MANEKYTQEEFELASDKIIMEKRVTEPTEEYDFYNNLENVNLLEYFNPAHTVAGVDAVKNALTSKFYKYVENQEKYYHNFYDEKNMLKYNFLDNED